MFFCSTMEASVYSNLRLEESMKIVIKSSLMEEKQQIFGSIISNCSCEWRLVDNLISVFFPLTSYICLSNFNECFLFNPILLCRLFENCVTLVLRYVLAKEQFLGSYGWHYVSAISYIGLFLVQFDLIFLKSRFCYEFWGPLEATFLS